MACNAFDSIIEIITSWQHKKVRSPLMYTHERIGQPSNIHQIFYQFSLFPMESTVLLTLALFVGEIPGINVGWN